MSNQEGIFDVTRAGKLENPGRLRELRAPVLLREAGLREGQTAVDLGSGTGVFALPMAEIVGGQGRVYAVDNSDIMIERLREKAPPPHLEPVKADVTATGLPDAVADLCLMAFIVHEVKEPARLMAEAARLLKPGGRAVVVDFRADVDSPGPPRHRRVTRQRIEQLIAGAGLRFLDYRVWSEGHYVALGEK